MQKHSSWMPRVSLSFFVRPSKRLWKGINDCETRALRIQDMCTKVILGHLGLRICSAIHISIAL